MLTLCLPLVHLLFTYFTSGGTSVWLLHGRYEELREGKLKVKKGKAGWEQVLAIKNSMYKVEQVKPPELCLPCEANPYSLACRVCKMYAHDGICKHVLAVTHIKEEEKDEPDRDPKLDLGVLCRSLVRTEEEDAQVEQSTAYWTGREVSWPGFCS